MSPKINDMKWHSYTSSTETMRTWAKLIDHYEDIPIEFQPIFPKPTEALPYTLLLPEDKHSEFQQEGSKLICLYEDYFTLYTVHQNERQSLSSTFADVIYLERGRVLLNSWLTIETISGTASLRFNTTNNHLFQPIIDKIRQGMVQRPLYGGGVPDLSKFDFLDKINFKYMNYGRACIRNGDEVVDVLHQPEQDIQVIGFFGKMFYRRYRTNHLTVLTEQELILIREDEPIRNNFDPTNGGVFTYIPRCKIEAYSFTSEQENMTSMMNISLPENIQLTIPYSVDINGLKSRMEMTNG